MERHFEDSPMVLRTVYLPRSLDTELRNMAFTQERSKSDLIRELLVIALQQEPDALAPSNERAAG